MKEMTYKGVRYFEMLLWSCMIAEMILLIKRFFQNFPAERAGNGEKSN
jgi:hypothetical protein